MLASDLPQPLADELLGRANMVRVSSLNADGTAHMFAAWFAWDGEHVTISTTDHSRKVRNIRRNPQVSLLIDESDGGLVNRGLLLYGKVDSIEGGDEAVRLTHTICARYMGDVAIDSPAFAAYVEAISPLAILRISIDKAAHWDTSGAETSARAQREAVGPSA